MAGLREISLAKRRFSLGQRIAALLVILSFNLLFLSSLQLLGKDPDSDLHTLDFVGHHCKTCCLFHSHNYFYKPPLLIPIGEEHFVPLFILAELVPDKLHPSSIFHPPQLPI